jgi:uncharacterized Ntn-hydrolase superfamily protein
MIFTSTFSIVAADEQESALGVAVASKFLAVGSVVPWAKAGVGAIATQSYANTRFGPLGLAMMESGLSAEETLQGLLSSDSGSDHRQVGIVDGKGESATYTGKSCYSWAGGLTGRGFAVQGNILTGEQVVEAMAEEFLKSSGNLIWRLYRALGAGEKAGGDRRGRQSAAILVVKPAGGYGGFNDRWVDLRVDDHENPIARLGEILELHDLYFGRSNDSERLKLQSSPLEKIQKIMRKLGYYQGSISGEYDPETRLALEAFIGNENFEDRTDFISGTIDKPVYDYILKRFGVEG